MRRFAVLIFSLFLLASVPGFCGGFSSLILGVGARSSGMGLAYTALADDATGSFWNPAGMLMTKRNDFAVSVHRWIQGVRSGFLGLKWGSQSTRFGIHLLYMEVGDIEHRTGPSPDPLSTFSSHEILAGFSYGIKMKDNFSMGWTFRLYYEKIYIEEALGFGADMGFLWEVKPGGIRVGGVVQHLGKTNRLKAESIPLPLTGKMGVAFPFRISSIHCFAVLDAVQEKDMPFHVHIGSELNWKDVFFLRLGYQTGYETRKLTGGLGISMKGYRLDYSYMPLLEGLGDSHRLTLGIEI